jgi:hypothetical protein
MVVQDLGKIQVWVRFPVVALMNKFKFRVGQTVHSPFEVVKIIRRWVGSKGNIFYDVKYMRNKKEESQLPITRTWTFEEPELHPFTRGGVADNQDDAIHLDYRMIDGEWIATVSVWIQAEIDGEMYAIEKQFKEKLNKLPS